MRIRVDEIPDSGRVLRFHWDEDRLRDFLAPDDPVELELVRPVNVHLELYKKPEHIRVMGSIEGILRLSCHRCLKPFEWTLSEKVDTYLVEQPPETEEEEEFEMDEEDLEFEYFDGEVIEIDRLVAEQIFLALPYKILCSEECRGLCPVCGADLNEEACKCEVDEDDSPFAALKRIKDKLP
jgi:uncharacterized protein